MDVLRLLEDEHDQAKSVFKKIEKAEGDAAGRLWDQLKSMLTLHEAMEEKFFYPQLKAEKQTEDLILESYQEHHVMDVLIEEISQLDPADEAWHPKVLVLQENTEHHIKEEEGELFPKVRKIWNTAKREQVGRQMQEMKDRQQKANRERRAA